MPTMPAPVCIRTGSVAQWYMKTPGCFATKLNRCVSPGWIVLNASFGATSEEW